VGVSAPPVIPGLQAGDLMGLMMTIQGVSMQPFMALMSGKFPTASPLPFSGGVIGSLLSGVLSLVSSVITSNPLLGFGAGQVMNSIVQQGLSFQRGILPPTKMGKNMASIWQAFSAAGMPPPFLGLQAALGAFAKLASPYQMPVASEMQVLLKAYEGVLRAPPPSAPINPNQGLLAQNQALSSRLMQGNQMFAAPAMPGWGTPTAMGGKGNPLAQLLPPSVRSVVQASQLSSGMMAMQGAMQRATTNAVFGLMSGSPLAQLPTLPPGNHPFRLSSALDGGAMSKAGMMLASTPLGMLASQTAQLAAMYGGMLPASPYAPNPYGQQSGGNLSTSQLASQYNSQLTRRS
jgi:hypothetical protein